MPKGIPKNPDRVRDTESFIMRAKVIHGNLYDYGKTVYVKSSQKVVITCPKHGDFEQSPNNHLSGLCGCKKCVNRQEPMGTDYWIEKFISVHGQDYDYSKFEARGAFIKSTVVCKATGMEFLISPDGHGNAGKGCPCCRYKKSSSSITMTISDAQAKISEKHGDKIKIKSGYKKFSEKCTLSCKYHGDFVNSPQVVCTTMNGCGKCFSEKENKGGFYNDSYISKEYDRLSKDLNNLYVMAFGGGVYKIGIAKSINTRKAMLSKEYKPCDVVYSIKSSTINVYMLEEHLHEIFSNLRFMPEISFAGETEMFSLKDEHVDFIKQYSRSVIERLSCHINHGKM